MRKSLVTLFLVCIAVSAAAVDLPKQGFGLHVGWSQPILRLNTNTSHDSLATVVKMNGVKVGLVYDASYIAGFGSSMGLNYTFGLSNGGWKSRYPQYGDYPKTRQLITYHQLEVFIDWQYKFEIAKETYLMLYTGPTVQCGLELSMRVDTKKENPNTGEIETIYGVGHSGYSKDAEPDQQFKRVNVTWGVGAGFQYKRYFLRGGYDFGLLVPYKNVDFENGNHTRGRMDQWNIRIGMYLWYED